MKSAYHYQLMHHIDDMEKIRQKFGISIVDHDNTVNSLVIESRRVNLKHQERLKLG